MRSIRAALLLLCLVAAGEARSEPQASEVQARAGAGGASDTRLVPRSEPQASEVKGWSKDLESELMSPFCPGRSLTECPSPQASELRLWIAAQEKAGVPRADVEAQLFRQYGDQLRASPRAEGFGLLAYLVPGLALLAGGAAVVTFLRRQGAGGAPTHPSAAADPELERRLEEELRAP